MVNLYIWWVDHRYKMQQNTDEKYRTSIQTMRLEIRKLDDKLQKMNANKRKLKRLLRELE